MNVNPTHRTTPTLGRKRSFFEELFGNIGSVGAGRPRRAGRRQQRPVSGAALPRSSRFA